MSIFWLALSEALNLLSLKIGSEGDEKLKERKIIVIKLNVNMKEGAAKVFFDKDQGVHEAEVR